MFRRPGTGRSKASADTLCQKCLKRGHYSYECKAPAQERPYKPRPSRTQQLLNPNLKPKLTTEVPVDLVRKKGVADEILKKKEEDRKRARSLSTSSIDSVSTISTNRSPSRSRSPPRKRHHDPRHRANDDRTVRKRSRRSASMDSRSSHESDMAERNTRRRMSAFSPGERGRRRTRSRSRTRSARTQRSHENVRGRGPRGVSSGARSRSRSAGRHNERPHRRLSVVRSRSRSADPMDTSDDRNPPNGTMRGRWGVSPPAKREPSRSPPPFRGTRNRSLSPFSKRRAAAAHPSPSSTYDMKSGGGGGGGGGGYDGHRGPARNRFDHSPPVSNGRAPPPPVQAAAPVQRERSLSPYSKRLALTKAMQAG
ncbi:nucleic acid binding [Pyrenophora seminiperda CCB06]|uniref:Nucleic acid binding n=1 Tax=Pyrenophora seminiperda CCB06 TaxID=1302712 RepID=A0A3M7LVE1_9PLEO|nr:nucleic acid binding [Pyrenophora seminiperda CCB06]